MITEDYVSFETAKLLKEKGFNENGYASIKVFANNTYEVNGEWIKPSKDTVIPTLQMVMKWLRVQHNLHIITLPYAPFDRHSYYPGFEADMVYIAQLFKGIVPIDEIGRSIIKLTPEEACESAIKYCLENLI